MEYITWQGEASLASGGSFAAVGSHMIIHKVLAIIYWVLPCRVTRVHLILYNYSYCRLHFTNEETKVQKDKVTSKRAYLEKACELGLELGLSELASRAHKYHVVPGHTIEHFCVSVSTSTTWGQLLVQGTPSRLMWDESRDRIKKSKVMCKGKVLFLIRKMLLCWVLF